MRIGALEVVDYMCQLRLMLKEHLFNPSLFLKPRAEDQPRPIMMQLELKLYCLPLHSHSNA